MASQLDDEEKSSDFHNLLGGFNRCWYDEFWPEEDTVTPLLEELFELHGYWSYLDGLSVAKETNAEAIHASILDECENHPNLSIQQLVKFVLQ